MPLNDVASSREHLADDDQQLEKLHRDAIEGKLRTKRKQRGVGLSDDSEEDEDDEHDRAIRRKLAKKRRIEGDSLDALGRCFWACEVYSQLTVIEQHNTKRLSLSTRRITTRWLRMTISNLSTSVTMIWIRRTRKLRMMSREKPYRSMRFDARLDW